LGVHADDCRMHRIGLISDTHGLSRPEAIAALAGSDHIIHAGDIGDESILIALRKIAPVSAVFGNCDLTPDLLGVSETEVVDFEGTLVYVLHELDRLDLNPRASGFSVVISGHTHKPRIVEHDGVLYVNPGSSGPRRFDLPVSVGLLIIEDGKVGAELIELECDPDDGGLW
jgi:putative phosphoesterase